MKFTAVRVAASSSVTIARATMTGEAANVKLTSAATAVSVANVGTTRATPERLASTGRGRSGRQIAMQMIVIPTAQTTLKTVPTTKAADCTCST